jgi:predicted homoserine dehydrogenase-like protein
VAECIAIAKRPLRAGETLDAIGEQCYRGSIDTVETARQERLLPLGLAKGCVLARDVRAGEPIHYDDLDKMPETPLVEMRQRQDRLYGFGR